MPNFVVFIYTHVLMCAHAHSRTHSHRPTHPLTLTIIICHANNYGLPLVHHLTWSPVLGEICVLASIMTSSQVIQWSFCPPCALFLLSLQVVTKFSSLLLIITCPEIFTTCSYFFNQLSFHLPLKVLSLSVFCQFMIFFVFPPNHTSAGKVICNYWALYCQFVLVNVFFVL